ncbi:Uncharacterised protein [Vibrio cholerae]|uniref:Uncharacterized protein n=1 Tax=Vibrio cholerae TaxID=666 RepID=A0A655XUX3_VIBCL|nr:Uncharacterised protein [Vibrio cholerae]CSA01081.1 Uncharacterised protein [Vibrio cholerae]CSB00278.1 Uncharacterised protein [Vibrio cholerae]CSB29951.1 Uncharacterised protein [Vibrio cholerae]CSB34790.1 Uncharacterised protein [Vibrio cholerae]
MWSAAKVNFGVDDVSATVQFVHLDQAGREEKRLIDVINRHHARDHAVATGFGHQGNIVTATHVAVIATQVDYLYTAVIEFPVSIEILIDTNNLF